jgi:hypothetical protein
MDKVRQLSDALAKAKARDAFEAENRKRAVP